MPRLASLSLAAAFLFASAPAASRQAALADARRCIAAFDFEFIDLSIEGEIKGTNSAEQQRLGLVSEPLRKWLAAGGHRKVCDMTPIAAKAKAANLYDCGCIQKLANAVGAELAITGVVQKVSNLILNISIDVFDVRTNRQVVQANAQIRSNTDRSWTRGLDWLIEHRLAGALAALGAGEP
jgi:uncharacterized protein DUF2380